MTEEQEALKLIFAELDKPLDQKHVKPPAPGKYGEYIEGWHAIAEANRILGFDGWSYCVDRMEKTAEYVTQDKYGNDQHRVGYMAIVAVQTSYLGVSRQDVGHGSGASKSLEDAHEGAMKEAVTDALKRALRTLGHPFGLALYDKTKTHVVDSEAEERAAQQAAQAVADAQAELVACESMSALEGAFRALAGRYGSYEAVPAEVVATFKEERAKITQTEKEAA